jgi:superfamily II RNA helicase
MSTHFSAVAARSATALRQMTEKVASLQQENHQLRAKISEYEQHNEIADLAREMEEKGLNQEMTFEEKVASIRNSGRLENVKEAVKMASAGYIRLADVSEAPGRGSTDTLTAFCLGAE